MNFTMADFKFFMTFLGALIIFWRVSSWVTRKQVIIESFLSDMTKFMASASASLHRIETNHLVHIQDALTGRDQYIQVIAKDDPPEEISDAV